MPYVPFVAFPFGCGFAALSLYGFCGYPFLIGPAERSPWLVPLPVGHFVFESFRVDFALEQGNLDIDVVFDGNI